MQLLRVTRCRKIGGIFVSLIACTSRCVYQQDGYCALQRAGSCGMPSESEPCVNFVPRRRPDHVSPSIHAAIGSRSMLL